MTRPQIIDDPLFALLREDKVKEFNEKRAGRDELDFRGGSLRGSDLRNARLEGVDFRGAYFRSTDLRGLDLSRTNLEGASIAEAKISGTLFPKELAPEEILLSVERGTRMRYL